MSPLLPYLFGGGVLFTLGLLATLLPLAPLRRILAINIMGSGVFLVLVATATDQDAAAHLLPRAMVLTGIAVAFALTAMALYLLLRLQREAGATR